jgi:hypothetical protein
MSVRVYIKSKKGWLDTFDGSNYTWTKKKKEAWRMPRDIAERRLDVIVKLWQMDAQIVECKR